MKILFISMPSIHAIRWIENLKESNHEVFWFDILSKGEIDDMFNITQIVNWEKRKIGHVKGEFFLRKKMPNIYNKIESFLKVTINEKLNNIVKDIKPDVVHSFEMQSCTYPILKTLLKFPKIKFIYSCWGSDLFYYQNFKNHNFNIRKVLSRVDYLHTDCLRDFNLAKSLGFKGFFLGVIPGGSGYDVEKLSVNLKPLKERNIILVKGYEHTFGRALNVIKALRQLEEFIKDFNIVVFSAHKSVADFIYDNKLPYQVYYNGDLSHNETLKLIGTSKIYIGNSVSDGMPNTLLEAFVMGAFPIQSNPGGVTSEVIKNGLNGVLINKPNDVEHIKNVIYSVVKKDNAIDFETAIRINNKIAREKLDITYIKKLILEHYYKVSQDIKPN